MMSCCLHLSLKNTGYLQLLSCYIKFMGLTLVGCWAAASIQREVLHTTYHCMSEQVVQGDMTQIEIEVFTLGEAARKKIPPRFRKLLTP